jgi:acetyltransferase-like isoleucine patch superfamily enzyme
MLAALWKYRVRPPFASHAWLKVWAKRVMQLPALAKQWRYHARLRRCGATVAGSAFFSDAMMINGGALGELSVGEESFVGRVEIAAHARVTIGARVCINDGALLLTASHDVSDPAWRSRARSIVIHDYAWVATNAIVLPGVTIGRGAVVGAGAVVARDVPDYGIVAGNPAKVLDKRRVETLDYSPTATLAVFEAWLGKSNPIA